MENILQKIGKFLGEKFALIDKDFAKKTELEKETERAKKSEEELSDTKVAKEEGKQLMPSPSTTPAENKFLSEDGTWKEIDMTSVNESISGLEDADSELERKLNEEITRAKGVEEKKVDKLEGKGLSANDYTSEEKNKLKNIGTYVNDIYPSYGNEERLKLVSSAINSESGATTDKSVIIPEANSQKNGLLSSLHYSTLKGLMNNGLYLDATGTPSNTWQLSKSSANNTGPLIKNSGGVFELRKNTDDAYTDLVLNNIVIKGNVTQEGSSFITNAETVETADNTILINKGEVGAGVTKGKAGLEIDRGTLPAYKILFDESDDRFKAGQGNDLWPIMLREKDSDLTNGMLLSWNSNTKRAETTNNIPRGQYLNFISGGTNDDVIIGNTLFKSVLIAWKNKTTGEITDKVILGPGTDNALFLSTTRESVKFDKPVKATTFYNSSGQEVAYKEEVNTKLEEYLPLTGGALTGNISMLNGRGISFIGEGEASKATISYDPSNDTLIISKTLDKGGVQIYSKNSITRFHLSDDINNGLETIWDSGNDGHGSGLDADLLDGKHGSEYALTSEISTNYVTIDTAQSISGTKTFTAAVTSTAGFYDTSDIRLKSNVKNIKLSAEKIRLCEFDKSGRHSYGVIAQEIEKLYPTTVQEGKDGYKTVNYNEVLTIKCAELEKRIDMLEKKTC